MVFSTAIGMSLAVVLNWEACVFRTLYRTLLFLPHAVPGFISILVFKGLFNQNFGEINAILDALFRRQARLVCRPQPGRHAADRQHLAGLSHHGAVHGPHQGHSGRPVRSLGAGRRQTPWTNFWRITAPLVIKPLTPC